MKKAATWACRPASNRPTGAIAKTRPRHRYSWNQSKEVDHERLSMESAGIFVGNDLGRSVCFLRHLRCAFSALRAARLAGAGQPLADHGQPHGFHYRVCAVHRRRLRARRALWNRMGILEQKTEMR